MGFARQLPIGTLIELSRALRHNLGAGLSIARVFRQQAERGSRAARPVAGRLAAELEKGRSLERALAGEPAAFPALFVDLAVMGEKTGNLAEIFGELEDYYKLQQKLMREFRSRIVPIVIQFFAALLILAGVIFVLGAVAESKNEKPADSLGFGFTGTKGAVLFLALSLGGIAALVVSYRVVRRGFKGKAFVDEILLRIPVVGPCMKAFALGRFTLALRLTLETEMSILEAMRLSFRAMSNGAFAARAPLVLASLKEGNDLSLALAGASLFPIDFQNIVAVAEESGRLPEVMHQQARYYQEEAGRRLAALTKMAGYAVWLLYVIFMVVAIFRLASSYLDRLAV
jgi:type II secretory pathway component PulF